MDNKMFEKLITINVSELPRIYCYLNKWDFPDELIEFKPKTWEILTLDVKSKYIGECTRYIRNTISEKELLREWNKNRMSNIEFEIWWQNRKPLSDISKNILKTLYNIEKVKLN